MPPENSNDKIDKLLRAFANRRREQAGAPFDLHPATRGMLQAEVARMAPRVRKKEASASLFTRIILAGAMAVSIAICAVILFRGEPPASVQAPVALGPVSNHGLTVADTTSGVGAPLPGSAPIMPAAPPAPDLRLADGSLVTGSSRTAFNFDAAAKDLPANKTDLESFSLDSMAKVSGSVTGNGLELNKKGITVTVGATNSITYEKVTGGNTDFSGNTTTVSLGTPETPSASGSNIWRPASTLLSVSGGSLTLDNSSLTPPADSPEYERADLAKNAANARSVEAVRNKLDQIIIPSINFRDVTVRDAIEFLRKKSVELDTTDSDAAHRGVNIVLRLERAPAAESAPAGGEPIGKPQAFARRDVAAPTTTTATAPAPAAPAAPAPAEQKITLSLKNIPMSAALDYVTKLAGLKYKTSPNGVAIVPLSEATEVLVTKEYSVGPEFLRSTGANVKTARKLLENAGVQFPDGADANYLAERSKLVVRNTEDNLDLVDEVVDAATPQSELDLKAETRDLAYDFRIVQDEDKKLDRMIVPKVDFHEAALQDVIDYLSKIAPGLDTDGGSRARQGGLNFVLKAGSDAPKVTLSLANVSMGDALRQAAGQAGMTVEVDPYAIVIAPASESTNRLVIKEYKVPPGFLSASRFGGSGRNGANSLARGEGAESAAPAEHAAQAGAAGAGGGAGSGGAVDSLTEAGVQFPDGASASYFPASGKLLVRNTETNLKLVDKIVEGSVNSQLEEEATRAKLMAVTKTMQTMAQKMSVPDVVLATFQLQLDGDIVRIIDADGSIYTGKIEQPLLQKQLAESNGRTFKNFAVVNEAGDQNNIRVESEKKAEGQETQKKLAGVRAGITNSATAPAGAANSGSVTAAASNSTVAAGINNGDSVAAGVSNDYQQNGLPQQNFTFRATGLNRRLKQTVVFEGSYIAVETEQQKTVQGQEGVAVAGTDQNAASQTVQDQMVKDKETPAPPEANARIQGQAQIGESEKIDVDAVVVPLKAKATQ